MANFVTRVGTTRRFRRGFPAQWLLPDCDLTNVLANGECGNLLTPTSAGLHRYAVTHGCSTGSASGRNWEFSASVHTRSPTSVGGLRCKPLVGNRCHRQPPLAASDFTAFSTIAPPTRGPDGGGNRSPGCRSEPEYGDAGAQQPSPRATTAIRPAVERRRFDDERADPYDFPAGRSSGTLTDNCEILAKIPNRAAGPAAAGSRPTSSRRQPSAYRAADRGAAQWRVQSLPGRPSANRVVTSASDAGRAFTNAANLTLNWSNRARSTSDSISLTSESPLSVGGSRTSVNFDLYNAFNASTVLAENTTYPARPSTSGGCRRQS
jgi:hypothetical protein